MKNLLLHVSDILEVETSVLLALFVMFPCLGGGGGGGGGGCPTLKGQGCSLSPLGVLITDIRLVGTLCYVSLLGGGGVLH